MRQWFWRALPASLAGSGAMGGEGQKRPPQITDFRKWLLLWLLLRTLYYEPAPHSPLSCLLVVHCVLLYGAVPPAPAFPSSFHALARHNSFRAHVHVWYIHLGITGCKSKCETARGHPNLVTYQGPRSGL